MAEIESDTISDDAISRRGRFVRKQSIVDVMGSEDLIESIQTENLNDIPSFPEIDCAVAFAVASLKGNEDSDQKLHREVELIKYLIHKAKEILDDAAHSPLLDKNTLTILSCNVNTISANELQTLQRIFASDKCFYCLKNMNYCYDVNHDSVRCVFEDTTTLNLIEGIIRKYGHKHIRQYDLADMLLIYKMYREKGLVN